MTRLLLVPMLLGLSLAAPAQNRRGEGKPPAHPLLRLAMDKADDLTFAGVRTVTISSPSRGTVTFVERVLRQGRSIRITEAPGSPNAGRIVVDDGKSRHTFDPATNTIRLRPSMGEAERWLEGLAGTGGRRGRNLQVAESDGGRIAGHPVRRLSIRYGERGARGEVYIDPRRGMVLKSAMLSPEGRVLSGFEYTAIRYGVSIPTEAFALRMPGARVVQPEDDLARQAGELKIPAYVLRLEGWTLTSVRDFKDPNGAQFLFLRYRHSDGRRVSITLSKTAPDTGRLRSLGEGRLQAVRVSRPGVSIVVMGELPEADLKSLSRRIVPLP
ncbi:MAG: hypothetical protein MH204_06535 [Fimbriimonadaceae bacterium]|nr:hypothetical protein [Fimbriimonadaceae bacterium]